MKYSRINAHELRERVNGRLVELTDVGDDTNVLSTVIQYALLASGKRLRPLICIMSAKCLGGDIDKSIDPACAIEMVHTASLIVDDLPCMDDANMRRGQLTCHQRFGEAVTILAALELVTLGYRTLSRSPGLSEATRIKLVQLLARAVGVKGLIGGQQQDLSAQRDDEGDDATGHHRVTSIHELKTGALFIAAAESGGIVAGLEGDQLLPIRDFARRLGLAYQTLDDLLDTQGAASRIGKDVGKDVDKPTLVGVLGPEAAGEYANNLISEAMAALQPMGPSMKPLESFVKDAFGEVIVKATN